MTVEGGRMRTRLSMILIAILSAAPASGATRHFEVAGFEKVRVEGPFRVKLTTGVPTSASVSGPQSGVDRVAVDLIGRTLVIHNNLSAWGSSSDSQNAGPVEVEIGTHDLNAAVLMGAGLLQINAVKGLSFDVSVQGSGQVAIARADVDQFSVNLVGTASSIIAGRAGMLKLTTQGVSSFDGSGLVAKDATIAANGASTIKAGVTNSAKIDASGPAAVTLSGNPACIVKLGGSASVTGCGKSQ
jgi:hypothetical protein